MLLHSREFPRSVLFCLSELQLAIHSLSKCPVNLYDTDDTEAERRCGRLISDLLYNSIAVV